MERTLIEETGAGREVRLCGWIHRLRVLKNAAFIVLRDLSGTVQIVASPEQVAGLKLEDVIEVTGLVRAEPRAAGGREVEWRSGRILNRAVSILPFTSASTLENVPTEVQLQHRPLSLRTEAVGEIFRVQAAILELFRAHLRADRFTEIVTSKLVATGTEGGSNLFEVKYFERVAYLAQSPQFYKEHGVAGLERVFETGHVYRAEPHATSRHLTEYCSLDLELGFVESAEPVMELERRLLTAMFTELNRRFGESIRRRSGAFLPELTKAPIWEFPECVERLRLAGITSPEADLTPEGERMLCTIAERELGVPAVFVVGFPLSKRPFYVHPRGENGAAQSFDLLFRGLEITTGGQRLHTREALEASLRSRGLAPGPFEGHLRMFELGMPPHGGLAIGLERLTAQVLGLANVREATLYPRDRVHLAP
ncbi:MAG: aspartate--tRNA(Asn) ligase [Archangium sp.]|nr:aspartate--tRNA(Asn) ligase [Archangium sp.]